MRNFSKYTLGIVVFLIVTLTIFIYINAQSINSINGELGIQSYCESLNGRSLAERRGGQIVGYYEIHNDISNWIDDVDPGYNKDLETLASPLYSYFTRPESIFVNEMFDNNLSRYKNPGLLTMAQMRYLYANKYDKDELLFHSLNSVTSKDGTCGIRDISYNLFDKDFTELTESEWEQVLQNFD